LENSRAMALARHEDELAAIDAELETVRAGCPHLQTTSYWEYDDTFVVCLVCGSDLTGGQT
jgi:hypothetical protein